MNTSQYSNIQVWKKVPSTCRKAYATHAPILRLASLSNAHIAHTSRPCTPNNGSSPLRLRVGSCADTGHTWHRRRCRYRIWSRAPFDGCPSNRRSRSNLRPKQKSDRISTLGFSLLTGAKFNSHFQTSKTSCTIQNGTVEPLYGRSFLFLTYSGVQHAAGGGKRKKRHIEYNMMYCCFVKRARDV